MTGDLVAITQVLDILEKFTREPRELMQRLLGPIADAAGERWADGSLRPAIEDMIGAGAVLHALGLPCSPEAEVARQAFLGSRNRLAELVRGSVSGRELIGRGYPADVDAAIECNVSSAAPLLLNGAYSNGC